MAGYLTSWERRLSGILPDFSEHKYFAKKAALVLLASQAMLCLGAVVTRVMLYGDGSYFVFAMAAGEPWKLKWKDLATRASTYAFTVIPSEFLSKVLELSGEHIAAVNGFTFYSVQWIQYLLVVLLAWRQFPHLLIYPILQYGLSTGLGFGYPSEILLAPGFFWICLFSLIRTQVPWALLCVAFAGLVFSHELAIPSALLILAFNWRRQGIEPTQGPSSSLFACFAIIILAIWLAIRLHGGGTGGDSNAIYVFDPRRVLNNPTLWLVVVAIVTLGAISRSKFAKNRHFFWLVGVTCFFFTVIMSSSLNVAQGRYDSARTIIAVCMTTLGIIFVASQSKIFCERDDRDAPTKIFALKSGVIALLSINLAASMVFLYEWDQALKAFSSVVNAGPDTGNIEIVSDEKARALLGSVGSRLNERMDYSWTWPYRSIVVAKGFRPNRVIVNPEEALAQCKILSLHEPKASRIPQEVIDVVSGFACAQPAPPDRRYFRQWLLQFWMWR
jgi:hypothetical protein